jgi:hypothetical protein
MVPRRILDILGKLRTCKRKVRHAADTKRFHGHVRERAGSGLVHRVLSPFPQ